MGRATLYSREWEAGRVAYRYSKKGITEGPLFVSELLRCALPRQHMVDVPCEENIKIITKKNKYISPS